MRVDFNNTQLATNENAERTRIIIINTNYCNNDRKLKTQLVKVLAKIIGRQRSCRLRIHVLTDGNYQAGKRKFAKGKSKWRKTKRVSVF